MEQNKMKRAFDRLQPTQSQTENMWNAILEYQQAQSDQEARKRHPWKYAAIAAMAVLMISISGWGINAATDGRVVSAFEELIGLKGNQQIIDVAKNVDSNGIEVFASDIISIDDELLVFGNLRGIILYDVKAEEVLGTIDTQAIGGIYFDGESKQTCVVKEQNRIVVFNSESGKPYGKAYEYEVKAGGNETLSPVTVSDDADKLKSDYALWEKQQEKKVDTFERFSGDKEVEALFQGDETYMYSEKSMCWTDAAGENRISFLAVSGENYVLYTYSENTEQFSAKAIDLNRPSGDLEKTAEGDAGQDSENHTDQASDTVQSLPEFAYTGENAAVEAIVRYFQTDWENGYYEGDVWIPAFIILKEAEQDGEHLVFGNFYSFNYKRIGNILEVVSGGEMPACFHLKETESGYVVTSVDGAADGEDYSADIKAFTKDYKGLYEQYMDYDNISLALEAAQKEYLQMYVTDNQLEVQYYKDYGWDPVEIFAGEASEK